VIFTLDVVERLSGRIRAAYVRQLPWWDPGEASGSVWTAAASTLIGAHRDDPRLPLDPELFAASRPRYSTVADPWGDLTGERAVRRYRRRVARIVRQLRRELIHDLKRIQARERRGQTLTEVVCDRDPSISALGRYVAAVREGRFELVSGLRPAALHQHQSCPLYRLACRSLIPEATYPDVVATCPVSRIPVGAEAWN